MNSRLVERMQSRARAVRTRAAIRQWHYRQRHLAGGGWFRLRRILADARAAYVIPDDEARRLLGEGYRLEEPGGDVEPGKMLLFVDESRLSAVPGRRAIPVGLGPEFLAASAVALVAFD